MITSHGIEGGVIYALSSAMREAITRDGKTTITLDLRPTMGIDSLQAKLGNRGNKSLSSFLRSANFSPVAIALFHETTPEHMRTTAPIAERLKALPVTLHSTAGMARAISSAGGITRDALDEHYMLRAKPGVFAAGEMLDWEAPTGGYLLQACFSTGVAAAHGIIQYLKAA